MTEEQNSVERHYTPKSEESNGEKAEKTSSPPDRL